MAGAFDDSVASPSGLTGIDGLYRRHSLLIFLVLGALFLALDALWGAQAPPSADARFVVLGAEQEARLETAYEGRSIDQLAPAELRAVLGDWIETEVLVVEARRLGLDQSDVIVRRQLAQRMRFLIEDLHPVPQLSDDLRAQLLANPERYGTPPTTSFEHVYLPRSKYGERLRPEAESMLARLQASPDEGVALGSSFATGRFVKGYRRQQVERYFGKRFADALDDLPIGSWQGLVASSLGLHLVRVSERYQLITQPTSGNAP